MCQIWACYHGFCHVCGHFHVHMPWNPHKSILDRQICEGFFSNLLYCKFNIFPQTSAHMMAQCKGIWIFEPFFIFFVFFSNWGQTWSVDHSYKMVWNSYFPWPKFIHHQYWSIKWFLAIFRTKLCHTCSANLGFFW